MENSEKWVIKKVSLTSLFWLYCPSLNPNQIRFGWNMKCELWAHCACLVLNATLHPELKKLGTQTISQFIFYFPPHSLTCSNLNYILVCCTTAGQGLTYYHYPSFLYSFWIHKFLIWIRPLYKKFSPTQIQIVTALTPSERNGSMVVRCDYLRISVTTHPDFPQNNVRKLENFGDKDLQNISEK